LSTPFAPEKELLKMIKFREKCNENVSKRKLKEKFKIFPKNLTGKNLVLLQP
jgi:hypothetical protein